MGFRLKVAGAEEIALSEKQIMTVDYARRLQRNGLLSGTGGLSADPAGAVPYH